MNPLYASSFVADYLRPAAKKSRSANLGTEALRASQSSPLTQQLAGEQSEGRTQTVQGILRHRKIQTTLDLYTQEDSDDTRAAQGEFLNAVGMSTAVN